MLTLAWRYTNIRLVILEIWMIGEEGRSNQNPLLSEKKQRSKIPIVLGLIQDRVCAKGIADTWTLEAKKKKNFHQNLRLSHIFTNQILANEVSNQRYHQVV